MSSSKYRIHPLPRVLCAALVPPSQKGYGRVRKGMKMGNKEDQREGMTLCGQQLHKPKFFKVGKKSPRWKMLRLCKFKMVMENN